MDIYQIKEIDGEFLFREMSFDEIYKNPKEAEKDWFAFLKDGVKPWDKKECHAGQKKNSEM